MAKARRKIPLALKKGLEPIEVNLMLAPNEYQEKLRRQSLARSEEIHCKLEILRTVYGVLKGPDCWYQLCLALAQDTYPGFSDTAPRKPRKWTMVTLFALAGEMRRELDRGKGGQAEAALRIASREPWKSFLAPGTWRKATDRRIGETLLEKYTHMPKRYRRLGEAAFNFHLANGTPQDWDALVISLLDLSGQSKTKGE